jgi:hypothetical protein
MKIALLGCDEVEAEDKLGLLIGATPVDITARRANLRWRICINEISCNKLQFDNLFNYFR